MDKGKKKSKRGDTGRHHPYPTVQDGTTTDRKSPPNSDGHATLSERTKH